MKKLVGGKHSLASSARKTEYASIDLVPSDFSARKMDLLLKNVKKSKSRMGKMLGSLEHRYDSVFLDAPPAFSLVSENIFRAADCILLPLIPTTLSLRSYLQIVQFFEDKELDMGKLAPFFTQVDRRKKVHRETVDLYAGRDNRFLKTWIPYSSDVENMGTHRKPLPAYSQKSKASEAYRSLWAEIKGR
jgi:cellulose biosynthesis protein BcsQ